MEPEIQRALQRAGLKLGGGLLLVAAVVGIRVVTSTPEGVDAGVAQLEQLESELSAERVPAAAPPDDGGVVAEGPAPSSSLARPGPAPSGAGAAEGHDADRLVSCRVDGRTRFMRAADCLSRGGRSRDLPPPKRP